MQEAVSRYLEEEATRLDRVREALAVLGTFDAAAASALDASMRRTREIWR